MSNFWVRTIWGCVYAGTVVATLIYGGFWGQFVLAAVISTFCLMEFLSIQKSNQTLDILFGISLNLMVLMLNKNTPELLGLVWSKYEFVQMLLSQILLLLLIYWGTALFKHGIEAVQKVSPVVFGLVYISLPCLLFLEISNDWKYPLLVFILTWCSDTFAYLVGRLMGKRPLYEALSPKKTMEGFVGGVILTGIAGGLAANFMEINILNGFILGVLVSIAGTAGDLFESALKRHSGVKDSGRFIPGHGGALDRFDAFLFASVVVYSWFHFFQT
jgi:phosphatidate cytidylyltransferase